MNQKLHATADYHIKMIHIDLHVIKFCFTGSRVKAYIAVERVISLVD